MVKIEKFKVNDENHQGKGNENHQAESDERPANECTNSGNYTRALTVVAKSGVLACAYIRGGRDTG